MNLGQEILIKFKNIKFDGFDFCKLVNEEHSCILRSIDGVKALRTKKRGFKEFMEEIIPISFYVRKNYGLGRKLFVTWCGSNINNNGCVVSYDGLIEQCGVAVKLCNLESKFYLEVTSALLGQQYLADQLLNEEGGHFAVKGINKKEGKIVSEAISFEGTEYVDDFFEVLSKAISKKLAKKYPDKTVLVVCCKLDMLFMSSDWKLLESKIRSEIRNDKFIEIFIYDSTTEHFFSIYKSSD
jgi:hypothetical protein